MLRPPPGSKLEEGLQVVVEPIRLVGMVLAEQDDEWQDGRRYFRPETMTLIDAVIDHEEVNPTLLMAS